MRNAALGLLACGVVACGDVDSLEEPSTSVSAPIVSGESPQKCTAVPPTNHEYIPEEFGGVDSVFTKYGFSRVGCPPVSVRCDAFERPTPSKCFEVKQGGNVINWTIYCTENSVHSLCLLDQKTTKPDGSFNEVTGTSVPRRRGSCDLNCNLDQKIRPVSTVTVQLP